MTWRRHLGRALGAVVAAWAAYLLLANGLLLGGLLERLMSRNPVRTRIAWDQAWTVWPGRVEVRGFALTGQTVRTQYWLRVERGRLRVALTDLVRRHFHATSVEAAGVRYWQRRQLVPGVPRPVTASLEPTIPGLPDERPPLADLAPRQRRFPWRVTLAGVNAERVEEVWIAAYHGRGAGHLAGDLWFEVGGDVAVPSFALVFPALEVDVGGTPVGRQLTVELDGELAPGPSRGQRLVDFLGRASGQVTAAGEVADFGFLNLVTSRLPRFRLRGAGELEADVTLERGLPTAASRIRYQAQRISAVLAGIEIAGRGTAVIARREDGRVELAADIRDLGASGRGIDTADDAVPHLEVLASSALTDLEHLFADPRLALDLPRCRVDDLAALNDVLPPGLPLRFQAASTATVAGRLTLDERSGSGAIHLEGDHIEAVVNRRPMAGSVALDLILEDADPDDLIFDIAGSAVRLASSERRHDEWRAEARFPEAVLGLAAPLQLQGRVEVTMTDTRPLVEAFAPKASTLLADLMVIDDIEASAAFDLTRAQMAISDLEASGSGVGRALLGGSGATVVLRSADIDPSQGFRGLHLDLDLADAAIPDLAVLNRYLPRSAGVTIAPAHAATLTGHVEVDDRLLRGAVRLEALGVGLEVCHRRFVGDLVIELALPAARVDRRHLDLSGSRLWLGQMVDGSGRGTKRPPWSAQFDVVRGEVELAGTDSTVTASLEAWLDTTGPLVAAYLPESGAGFRLEDLLNVDAVALSADLVATPRALGLDHLALTGRGTVAGHLRGPGFALVADELALDSERGITRVDLGVTLPRSEVVDLSAFNRFIPAAAGLRFADDSQGAVSAELRVVDDTAWGQARVEAEAVALELGPLAVVGDLTARLNLRHLDFPRQTVDLGGSSLAVGAATLGSEPGEATWWARLDLPRATLDLAADALAARLFFEMGDSRPLVGLVTSPEQAWLADLVTFTEVTGTAAVHLAGDTVHLDEMEVRGFGSSDTGIFGPGLTVSMSARDVDLGERGEGLAVTVDLPPAPVHDLARFNRYLPPSSGLTLLPGGEGEVSAHLELADGRASGHFRLVGRDVGAALMGADARGDLALDVPIRSGDLSGAELDISGTTLRLSGLRLDDGRGRVVDDWWADLTLPEARVHMDYPVAFAGTAELALCDSWPLASLAAAHGFWGRVLRPLLVVDDIVGRATLGLDRSGLVLDELALSGERLSAEGRLRLDEDGASGIVLLSFRGLDGAVRLDHGRQRFKLFRPKRWYRQQVGLVDLGPAPARP